MGAEAQPVAPEVVASYREGIIQGAAPLYALRVFTICMKSGVHPTRLNMETFFKESTWAVSAYCTTVGLSVLSKEDLHATTLAIIARTPIPENINYLENLIYTARCIFLPRFVLLTQQLGKYPTSKESFKAAYNIVTHINDQTWQYHFDPPLLEEIVFRVMAIN